MKISDFLKPYSRPSGLEKKSSENHDAFIKLLIPDLKNINKDDFVELGEEVNLGGTRCKRFTKSLVKTEMGMFNQIDILEFDNGEQGVYYKAPAKNLKVENIAQIVNQLHKEYGEDFFGNKLFDIYDENSINRDFWTGRYWNKNKPRISIKLMNDCLELAVTGIKKK
jgi:hypothetical protein